MIFVLLSCGIWLNVAHVAYMQIKEDGDKYFAVYYLTIYDMRYEQLDNISVLHATRELAEEEMTRVREGRNYE